MNLYNNSNNNLNGINVGGSSSVIGGGLLNNNNLQPNNKSGVKLNSFNASGMSLCSYYLCYKKIIYNFFRIEKFYCANYSSTSC